MSVRRLLIALFAACLPIVAAAQDASTTKFVNLRAGPARDYPLVATLGPGTPLAVQGCTEGYGWCDVVAPNGVRGWVYAGNLAYPYQNNEVPLLGYGAAIGLPIVTFSIGSYWNDYYRNRPWYHQRDRWAHHRPPPRPIVRPPRPGPRPPYIRPRPGDARPPAPRPPGGRPPGDARPPGGGHSPGARPPGARPPGGRPPGGRPSGGRPESGRPGGGDRPQR